MFDFVVTWMWDNIFNGFDIDEQGLNKVREAAKKSSLVIVPCHKSHVDYLVLSQIFFHNNMTPPHIAAGINLSFFPLGHIFRKSGAFFLKRTFRGDPLYPIVFSTYVKTILSEGFSLEFFHRRRAIEDRQARYAQAGTPLDHYRTPTCRGPSTISPSYRYSSGTTVSWRSHRISVKLAGPSRRKSASGLC